MSGLALRLALWLISACFALVLAYLIARQLRTGSTSLDTVAFAVISVVVITAHGLLLGLAGGMRASTFGLSSLAGLVFLALSSKARAELAQLPLVLRQTWKRARDGFGGLPLWLRVFLLLGILLSSLRFAFLIWALPPFVWDALTYHLTNVAHWIQVGRIELFDTPVIRIYTPANYEVLAAWFAVFLHHDAFVEAAGLPAYYIALAATWSIARSLGCSPRASSVGVAGFATTPALLIAVTGTKNDPHMAGYYLAIVAILLHLTRNVQRLDGRTVFNNLTLIALTLLLAAGTKAYLIHLLPGIVVLAVLVRRGVLGQIFRSARAAFTQMDRGARLGLLGLGLVGLFLAGYWNVRNWALTGNPFYPYGVSIQGADVFDAGDRTAQFSAQRLGANLQLLRERFGDSAGPVQPDLPDVTGWGWFTYGLGLAALLWAIVRRKEFRPLFAAATTSLLFMMFSIRPSSWNMRYLTWYPVVAAVAFALWYDVLALGGRWYRVGFAALAVIACSLNFAMTVNYGRIDSGGFALMLERPLWQRQAAVLKLNMPEEYEHALVQVPNGATLAYDVGGDGFVYPLFRADFSQKLVYVPVQADLSCDRLADHARSLGADYLFVARGHSSDSSVSKMEQCAIETDRIQERGRGVYVIDSQG